MRRAISQEGVNIAAKYSLRDLRNTAPRRCASRLQHVLSPLPVMGPHRWSLAKICIRPLSNANDLEEMCCRGRGDERGFRISESHLSASGVFGLDAT